MTTQTIFIRAKKKMDDAKRQYDLAKVQLLEESANGVIFNKLTIGSYMRVGAIQFDLLGLSKEEIDKSRKPSFAVQTIKVVG